MQKNCSTTLKKVETNLPEVFDLFSGCGGLALGFKASGYNIKQGIEISESASKTFSYNFYWKNGLKKDHICADVKNVSSSFFKERFDDNGCIIVGGPPCQAYSKIGKAKLRSLGEDRISTNDPRGYLFNELLRFAYELNTKAVVVENVPESTNYGGINIPQYISESLEKKGFESYWTLLNSADFGVPQIRERIFVVGIRRDIIHSFELPEPTHRSNDLNITRNEMRFKYFSKFKNFKKPKKAKESLPNWITVGDAILDLPVLFSNSNSKYKLNKLNMYMDYKSGPQNQFQKKMRTWSEREERKVTGHAFRKNTRDFIIFEKMNQGDDYRDASKIADLLLEEECRLNNINKIENPQEYKKLRKKIVPPYDRSKFFGKWKRLDQNKPSHTLVAHLDTDTYSHIHPWEPRGISVREAARLQSFPDDFLFQCTMGDAFRQIGNAVPPLLSKSVAESIKKSLMGS